MLDELKIKVFGMLPAAWRRAYSDARIDRHRAPGRIAFTEQFIPKGGIGAELGFYKGTFSAILLKHAAPKELHLVDTDEALFNRVARRYAADRRVTVHHSTSWGMLEKFADGHFDWLYLDTSHQYDGTKRELALMAQKIKPDGVVAGDDWCDYEGHRHYGVAKAVKEFVKGSDFNLLHADAATRQWAVSKKGGGAQ